MTSTTTRENLLLANIDEIQTELEASMDREATQAKEIARLNRLVASLTANLLEIGEADEAAG